jgi:hypothetical protein
MSGAAADIVRKFLFPGLEPGTSVTARAVQERLKAYVDKPIRYGGKTLVLKSGMDEQAEQVFWVETLE